MKVTVNWEKREAYLRRLHEQRRQRKELAEQLAEVFGDPTFYREELLRYLRGLSDCLLFQTQELLRRRKPEQRADFLLRCRREKGWERRIFVWLVYLGWRPRGFICQGGGPLRRPNPSERS